MDQEQKRSHHNAHKNRKPHHVIQCTNDGNKSTHKSYMQHIHPADEAKRGHSSQQSATYNPYVYVHASISNVLLFNFIHNQTKVSDILKIILMSGLIVVLVLGILLLSYRSKLFHNGIYGLDTTTSHMKRTVTSVPLANNPIIQENKLPGSTTWQPAKPAPYNGQRFPDIEGYALSSSAIAGDTVYFAVSTNTATFQADLYRLGYYQGKGGRFIEAIRATVGANFPGHAYAMPTMDKQTGLMEADWPVAFKIHIDRSWVTGIYLVKLTNQAGYQGYIPFVIRSQRVAPLVFLHADITEQAYNPWGGKSLYAYNSTAHMRAYKVSYYRPLAIEGNPGYGLVLLWEYPMIRYLEEQGYDLSYLSMADIAPGSPAIRGAKGILIVGHNEYWSKDMRDTIEQAVSHGVNLANFAADTMYTQIRYEPSINGSMPNRTIVCYRDATLD